MKKILKGVLLTIVLCVSIVTLSACNKGGSEDSKSKNPLVGSWKYQGGNFTYTFNDDGTGTYDASGNNMEFTYKTDGNKISITYTGNTAAFETEYSIDGDTLNVKDSLGNDTLYKKVK